MLDTLHLAAAGRVANAEVELLEMGNDQVRPESEKFLFSQGVTCSSQNPHPHPHGDHKAIANVIHLQRLAKKISSRFARCTIINLKRSKFAVWQKYFGNCELHFANGDFDTRDRTRYSDTPVFDGNVRDRVMVFVESAQFMTVKQLGAIFHKNPTLQCVYMSGVLTPEVANHWGSMWPEISQLRYDVADPSKPTYLLEDSTNGQYETNGNCELLHPSAVCYSEAFQSTYFTIHVEEQICNHFVICAQRRSPDYPYAESLPASYAYGRPDMSVPPNLFLNADWTGNNGVPVIPKDLLMEVVTYLPLLKASSSDETLMAKISNMKKSPAYKHVGVLTWNALYHLGVACRDFKFGEAGPNMIQTQWLSLLFLPFINGTAKYLWSKKFTILKHIIADVLGWHLGWIGHLATVAWSVYEAWSGDQLALGILAGKGVCSLLFGHHLDKIVTLATIGGAVYGWRLAVKQAKFVLYSKMLESSAMMHFPRRVLNVDCDDLEGSNWQGRFEASVEETNEFSYRMFLPMSKHEDLPLDVSNPAWYASDFSHCAPSVQAAALIEQKNQQLRASSTSMKPARKPSLLTTVEEECGAAEIEDVEEAVRRSLRVAEKRKAVEEVVNPAPLNHDDEDEMEGPLVVLEEEDAKSVTSTMKKIVVTNDDDEDELVEVVDPQPSQAPFDQLELVTTSLTHPEALQIDQEIRDGTANAETHEWMHEGASIQKPEGNATACRDETRAVTEVVFADDGTLATTSTTLIAPLENSFTVDSGFSQSLAAVMKFPAEKSLNPRAKWAVMEHGDFDDVPYERTCGVEALALALETPPELLWSRLCESIPANFMRSVKEQGTGRVFFEAAGVALEITIQLSGDANSAYDGKPHCYGWKATMKNPAAHLFLDTSVEPAHWWLKPTFKRRPLPLLANTPGRSIQPTAEFMQAVDNYVDEHGEKIPGQWVDYEVSADRCAMLAAELDDGTFGLMKRSLLTRYDKDFLKTIRTRVKVYQRSGEKMIIKIRVALGFNGCGKSAPMISFLSKRGKQAAVGEWQTITPRTFLRGDLYKKIGPKGGARYHNTFETACARSSAFAFVDECGLFAPGFLDLYAINGTASAFFITGAVDQCLFNNPNPLSNMSSMTNEILHIVEKAGATYWMWSHRIPQFMARSFEIESSNPVEGFCRISSGSSITMPLICSTDAMVQRKRSQGYEAYTPGTIQGQTHKRVQILVDNAMLNSVQACDLISALCRVTEGIYLIREGIHLAESLKGHKILGALSTPGRSFSYELLAKNRLKGQSIERRTEYVREVYEKRLAASKADCGHSASLPPMATTEVFNDLPTSMRALYGLPTEPIREQSGERGDETERYSLDFHRELPDMPEEHFAAYATPEVYARAQREAINVAGETKTYDDFTTAIPECYLFPRQRSNDAAFVIETIKARITGSTIEKNNCEYQKKATIGQELFNLTREALGLPMDIPFNEERFMLCLDDQIRARIRNKSAAFIDQYEERSTAWLMDFRAKVRVKGQLKAKMEALALPKFKAGQTINVLPEWVIAYFGVWVRYMKMESAAHMTNAHVCINSGFSLHKLNEIVRANWKKDSQLTSVEKQQCTINDFSAFGASQRGDSLHMDMHWLAWAHCPLNLLEVYRKLKTELLVADGKVKSICRDDGEPGTFDFNTRYNIAVCAMRFGRKALHKGFWLFAGDDMACDYALRTQHSWFSIWEKKIHVLSKLFICDVADFCGWILLEDHGILRDPLGMWFKIRVKLAHGGNPVDFTTSYATELAFTYNAIRNGAELDPCSTIALKLVLNYFHKQVPVLSSVLFAKTNVETVLEVLTRRLAHWESHQFKGRKGVIRAAKKAITKFSRGFSKDMDPYMPTENFVLMNNQCTMSQQFNTTTIDSGAQDQQVAVRNTTTPTLQYVGQPWDGNLRRFAVSLATIKAAKAILKNATTNTVTSIGLNGVELVKAFVAASPRAELLGLDVSVQFFGQASGIATIYSAFNPLDETAYAAPATFFASPSCQVDVVGSVAAGGVIPTWRREMAVGEYGISRQIKPKPLIGDIGRLNVLVSVDFSQDVAAANVYGRVMAYFVVRRF